MSGQRKCPDCGSLEIVEDSHYAQSQLVCADCGFILTEGLLTTTYADEEHLHEVTYSRSTGQSEQQSRSLVQGIRRVRDLCKVLFLPALFEDTAVSYYQQAMGHPCFHLARLEKKEILVGCCVFVTCRQHNWPLTLGTLSVLLYANKDLLATTYLCFLKELALDVPSLSLMSLVKTHINSFTLFENSASVPPKFLEDKEQLVARTIQIVELASETWLVSGRHPIPIVTAAAYLAWKSLRPVDRLTCSLSQFCKIASIALPQPAFLRLRELQNIFLQMSSHLPWLRVLKVDKRSVVKHVGDLLKHRRVLLQTAFCRADTVDDTPESSELIAPSARETETPAAEEDDPRTGEKQALRSKRPLLLPPCILHSKKRLRSSDPDPECSAITGDEPILDSEIKQYIRTPKEQKLHCKAQSCL